MKQVLKTNFSWDRDVMCLIQGVWVELCDILSGCVVMIMCGGLASWYVMLLKILLPDLG